MQRLAVALALAENFERSLAIAPDANEAHRSCTLTGKGAHSQLPLVATDAILTVLLASSNWQKQQHSGHQ